MQAQMYRSKIRINKLEFALHASAFAARIFGIQQCALREKSPIEKKELLDKFAILNEVEKSIKTLSMCRKIRSKTD